MNKNILLCGVGGQGIVLTSKLTAAAAMEKGYDVMSAETIGMAQKGGSVFSFLRIGEDMYSPMFGKKSADIIIAFEPAEAVRMIPYLKDNGCVIVNTNPVMPVTSALKAGNYNGNEMLGYLRQNVRNLVTVDGIKACQDIGSPKVLNMIMLGKAVKSGVLPFSIDDVTAIMEKTVKPQFVEMNKKALNWE